jgi:pimeloyl-ACP methyl ester carboxylesterase
VSRFVLVHGAWHGAWCWYKLVPRLERAGHRVIALDLPSHGKERTPIAEVTLERYADAVCNALGLDAEPAILVGHSMGGIAITQAAERHPERIKSLVYLAAFLLRDGDTLTDAVFRSPARTTGLMIRSEDKLSTTVNQQMIRDVFYAQCSEEDVALARLLLQPQAVAPMITAQRVTAARFGRVPRVYIECLRDKIIEPALQKTMYMDSPCEKVLSIDTDHSPFFSRVDELADRLLDLAVRHALA